MSAAILSTAVMAPMRSSRKIMDGLAWTPAFSRKSRDVMIVRMPAWAIA